MSVFKLNHCERLDSVSDVEWREAMECLSNYLTKKLAGKTVSGAFSESVLGVSAVEYFSKLAFIRLYSGQWKWKESLGLKTQLIRIARSEMSHHLRNWLKSEGPQAVRLDNSISESLLVEDDSLDVAYEIALSAAKDDPQLVAYINAVRDLNNYDDIAKELNISKKAVYALQRRLIRRLKK